MVLVVKKRKNVSKVSVHEEEDSATVADCTTVFSDIYKNNAWGTSSEKFTVFSGEGSHDLNVLTPYVTAIRQWMDGLHASNAKPKKAVDLGCGDLNIGKLLAPMFYSYIAADAVPELKNHFEAVLQQTLPNVSVSYTHLTLPTIYSV